MAADRLVVLNKDEDTLSVHDPDTGTKLTRVPTAFNPHEIVADRAGGRVFVTCSLGNRLLEYDTDGWERGRTIEQEGFDFPHGLAIRESAGELWLVATRSSQVFVFDIDDMTVLDQFPTGQDKSHMLALDHDERYAYIANIGSDSVTVVDCDRRHIVGEAPVGAGPEGIAVHPEAGVLVANQEENYLTVLDPDTLEEASRSVLGTTPVRVVVAPASSLVLVANRESNDVSVVDPEFERGTGVQPWEIARIPVGIWPGGIAVDGPHRRAFVANNKTNDISVIDLEGRSEVRRIDAGLHPDGIALVPG